MGLHVLQQLSMVNEGNVDHPSWLQSNTNAPKLTALYCISGTFLRGHRSVDQDSDMVAKR